MNEHESCEVSLICQPFYIRAISFQSSPEFLLCISLFYLTKFIQMTSFKLNDLYGYGHLGPTFGVFYLYGIVWRRKLDM